MFHLLPKTQEQIWNPEPLLDATPKKTIGSSRSVTEKTSGLSQKQFCRRQSHAVTTFSYWKRRLEILKSELIKFYPLLIPAPTTPPADSGLLLLIRKKRFAIEIKVEFSPTTLKKLISALEQL